MLQYGYRAGAPRTPRQRTASDQPWISYLPINERPQIKWPNGARVAVWVLPNILFYEFDPPPDPWINSWARMQPDVMMYGRQEFGPRVGFWRMAEILDKHDIPCTATINVAALQRYPAICDAIVARKWDLLGHGMYNTRFICGYSVDEERAYYREMLRTVRELTGLPMPGMGGPGPQAGTENTPDLVAEAGFDYFADFFHDDQPFPINVSNGRLISMPYPVDLNDVPIFSMAQEGAQFVDAVRRQFDWLYRDGAESGQILSLAIHPVVIGQSQRTRYLDEALTYLRSFPDVWFATGSQIAQHYVATVYDRVAARLGAARNPA